MNIYSEALKEISFIEKLDLENFSPEAELTFKTAETILKKEALIYAIRGTRLLLCAHSPLFKTTPNEISWYAIESMDPENRIEYIRRLDKEEVSSMCNPEALEEIEFFINAAKKE